MSFMLGDSAELIKNTINPKDVNPETPYIGLEHIGEGTLSLISSGKASDIKSAKLKFQKGDILFGKLRPYFKKLIIAPFDGICSTDIWVIKPKNNFNRNFLFYWLASDEVISQATTTSEGTRMPRAQWNAIENISISPISNSKLEYIGLTLRQLDKKIQNNSEINKTLESIVQTLFKSWFIDFEPIHAKVKAMKEGRDPELAAMATIAGKTEAEIKKLKEKDSKLADTSLQLDNLRHIASLFPSGFVDSELGSIPNGWACNTIENEISIAGGGTPSTKLKKYWDNGKNHWATPKDLSGLKDKVLLNTERKITDLGLSKISSGQLPDETVLMSSRAPVGYLAIAKVPISINQGFIAMTCDKLLSNTYVLQWCYFNMSEIEQHAGGSTFAEISKKSFKSMKIIVPNSEIVNEYHKLASSIYELITNNVSKNHGLMNLRDYLLPKLISGQIPIDRLDTN